MFWNKHPTIRIFCYWPRCKKKDLLIIEYWSMEIQTMDKIFFKKSYLTNLKRGGSICIVHLEPDCSILFDMPSSCDFTIIMQYLISYSATAESQTGSILNEYTLSIDPLPQNLILRNHFFLMIWLSTTLNVILLRIFW